MKKLFLITYFALSLSASNCHKLIAASPFKPVSIGIGNFYKSNVQSFGIENPQLVNIFTTSSLIIPGFTPEDYEFILDGNNIAKASYWIATYRDSLDTEKSVSITFYLLEGKPGTNVIVWNKSALEFINGLKFSDVMDINITDENKFEFVEFIENISEDNSLVEKIEQVKTYGYDKNLFLFGVGVPGEMSIENVEINLDKNIPIYYSCIIGDNVEWQFCYTEKKPSPLDKHLCINDASISEDLLSHSSIYPNPASDRSFISLDISESCELKITLSDILGREILDVHNGFVDSGNFTKSINTSNLSKGVYFLKISIGKDYKVEKFIVE